jgi:catechol 2,3-dioxygenase-like lactoylglutathione lyase family enzyme
MRAIAEIALFTGDVERTAAFYRDLVGAPPVAEWQGGALFAVGGGKLLVHEQAAGMDDGPPNEDHFAISVDDIDEACAALVARGSAFLVAPRDYAWGRSAYLRDPDGRLVELSES